MSHAEAQGRERGGIWRARAAAQAITEALSSNWGLVGEAQAKLRLMYWSPSVHFGIVRCAHGSGEALRAAMSLVQAVRGRAVQLRTHAEVGALWVVKNAAAELLRRWERQALRRTASEARSVGECSGCTWPDFLCVGGSNPRSTSDRPQIDTLLAQSRPKASPRAIPDRLRHEEVLLGQFAVGRSLGCTAPARCLEQMPEISAGILAGAAFGVPLVGWPHSPSGDLGLRLATTGLDQLVASAPDGALDCLDSPAPSRPHPRPGGHTGPPHSSRRRAESAQNQV